MPKRERRGLTIDWQSCVDCPVAACWLASVHSGRCSTRSLVPWGYRYPERSQYVDPRALLKSEMATDSPVIAEYRRVLPSRPTLCTKAEEAAYAGPSGFSGNALVAAVRKSRWTRRQQPLGGINRGDTTDTIFNVSSSLVDRRRRFSQDLRSVLFASRQPGAMRSRNCGGRALCHAVERRYHPDPYLSIRYCVPRLRFDAALAGRSV